MPKKEVPIGQLEDYLPEGTYAPVLQFLREHKVHLTVARERKSILGDYRHRTAGTHHRISVNGNLNKYAFLITLLHELAHLLTFEQYGNRVASHGAEWKTIYAKLLAQFLQQQVFPADVHQELVSSLRNPAATTCAEDGLLRVLRNYDDRKTHLLLVEDIPANQLFRTTDGRVFRKGERLRKRFKCLEVATGKLYLFSPVYEVEWITAS